MGDQSITFLAYIPALQSAIQIHGGGDGMRLRLDVPEVEVPNALPLVTMRECVLRVTVEVDDDRRQSEHRKIHI